MLVFGLAISPMFPKMSNPKRNFWVSCVFFLPSGQGVNQKVYLRKHIIKRLLPFIQQYHADDDYMFWPDLASSHYAKSVAQFFREKNMIFVEKDDNSSCASELHLTENFRSVLNGLVYENNLEAQIIDQLKNSVKHCFKKVEKDTLQALVVVQKNGYYS